MKLIIVESPTKARTITKFLPDEYQVESSFGHVRDLPKSKMGVDPEKGFQPIYEIPKRAEERVAELRKIAKKADEIYLAPDEDREGEAIAWHLSEILNPKKGTPVKRITFHEITNTAIRNALKNPREINPNLVDAQQARRILDRLVGYELSPFLWQKVQYGLSAGRVQSVATRLIVERERERLAFKSDEYWTIDAEFVKDKVVFPGKLNAINGKKLEKLDIGTEKEAKKIESDLEGADYTITSAKKSRVKKKPVAPFTTSSLQIEANNRFGYSAKQTMMLAQKLYETGKITYMRTDSFNLSKQFTSAAQEFIAAEYGKEYAQGIREYHTKSKGAQEAHEAIRPTDVKVHPDKLKVRGDKKQVKMYELIWRRAVASQMPEAELERTSVDVTAKQYLFRSTGSSIVFDGFMKVYRGAAERILPDLGENDIVKAKKLEAAQHFTEPAGRYSDATLVKALEEHGIGRPSTYAPTIGTIIDRGYVERDDNRKLYPLDIANIVNDLLVEHFADVVDLEFTANMERNLDAVADGEKEWVPVLDEFYKPFHKNLVAKDKELKKEDVMKERLVGVDPESGLDVIVKNGRFGPFIQLGPWSEEDKKAKINKPKSASIGKGQSIDTLTMEQAMHQLILPREMGTYTNGETIVADDGRFGPYLKAGEITASLGEEYDPRTMELEDAMELLKVAEARRKKMMTPIAELGEDPTTKGQIQVRHGRYGPYVTDGETNASITKKMGIDPEKVTLEMAIEILKKKRKAPKRNWNKKK